MAVPSAMIPLVWRSQVTLLNIDSKAVWSVVMGHCVKASPPKSVNPMLSFSRPAMNSKATCLAASMRLGFKSGVSILCEMSIAIMISMPSTSRSLYAVLVCGRAKMTMARTKTSIRNTKGRCTAAARKLKGAEAKAVLSATRKVGSWRWRRSAYQSMMGMPKSSNRK